MASLESLLAATSEVAIAREVAIYHDIARIGYNIRSDEVESFGDFINEIKDYYSYHSSQCWEQEEALPKNDLSGQTIRILEQEYKACGRDVFSAYKDAHEGTNGGLMVILDRIAEHLKAKSIEQYIMNVFEKFMSPISQEAKTEIIHQFIAKNNQHLPSSILADQPERYADNYHGLIKAYVESLKKRSRIFRILPPPGETAE